MTKRFSVQSRVGSVRHALRGLAWFVSSQHNAWIHACATFGVVAGGIFFGISRIEWIGVALAIALVWTAEAVNTAIEAVCDAASPDFHPLVARTKDVAAAGVLIAACGAVAVGLLVFAHRLAALLG